MSKEKKPYEYFDSPDGHDTLEKLVTVLKPTTVTALFMSTADVLLYSHPKGYLNILGRYAFVGLPIIGITTAFVLATNGVASIRNKDDKINWLAGGVAAGSLVGVWARRPMVGFNTAIAFGIAACLRKEAQQNGWDMFPSNDTPISHGTARSVHQDWTLTKYRPGNWTTQKQ